MRSGSILSTSLISSTFRIIFSGSNYFNIPISIIKAISFAGLSSCSLALGKCSLRYSTTNFTYESSNFRFALNFLVIASLPSLIIFSRLPEYFSFINSCGFMKLPIVSF